MSYLKKLTKLISDTVDLINRDMEILNVDTDVDTHVITVCDVKYAQKGYTVTIDDNEYQITEVDADAKTITVTGTQPISVTYFELYPVYFFHGTPREVNQETSQADDASKFTPMIWLNEIFDENPDYDGINAIENSVTPRIFALGQRPEEKLSSDLELLYLDPMRRLMELFIDAIRKQTGVFDATEYRPTITGYAKFGVYVTNKGVDTNLFSSLFSGCENRGELLIFGKGECCGDKCKSETGFLSEDDEELMSNDNDILIPEL